MTADPQAPLRADAQRNRDLIIAAARAIFTEHGPEVPMEDIARAAKVGIGTLYRRFPDRDALIRAVAVDSFARLLAEVRAAAVEEPTAWDALVRIMHHSTDLQLTAQLAMLSAKALQILKEDEAVCEQREELLVELERLMVRAQAAGQLRPDVGAGDIAVLIAMALRRPPAKTPEIGRLSTDRCIAIMIDGLRAHPGAPLPGRPLVRDDLRR
ncbi:TetR/AcrR family transcriptional regulator [Kutzneria viridogrisea]|uniref:AcrR family transcriptional regulator n=1 Tax=Kutzneria viridogrisea TaxID=47990 RepID=A0ABR6BVJ2_9PSEU|nr:AcrR family transcriptional regulator [Kutzneria viridogrisea]